MSNSENTQEGFDPGYPENTVFGVIDRARDAIDAVSALRQTPIDTDNVEIISNEVAEKEIANFRDERPVAARVVKFLVVAGEESEEWRSYNQHLEAGRYMIRIPVENDEQAERVAEVLQQHGGHHVNYFGSLTVTRLVS